MKILRLKPYLYTAFFLSKMAIYVWQKREEHMQMSNQLKKQMRAKKFGNGTRDIVDEASWESFPASDPPASNKFT